jgi:hypothetical protein
VDAFGMYHDPDCPMVYHVVVMQQWALTLLSGYRGRFLEELSTAVRRAGLSSLLMQSAAAQAPYGGRSNQFHHNEAQSAALFEACAVLARQDGDGVLAGCYRRAARRSVRLIAPWILSMEPWRHIKQGFHPRLNHGTDSAGPYSVYGILTGSLCCIAASLADASIPEYLTPPEVGGYAFCVDPCFHRAFAASGGWSVQLDLKAQLTKDATGLGRVHRSGLRPETILSGSIPAQPQYTFAFDLPQRNAAIGPEWQWTDGATHRLADFCEQIERWEIEPLEQSADRVTFRVRYRGQLGGLQEIVESYGISPEGVRYAVALHPEPTMWRIVLPLIETDGEAVSRISRSAAGLEVCYREDRFRVEVIGGTLERTEELDTNKNARYRSWLALAAPDRESGPGPSTPACPEVSAGLQIMLRS